MGNLILLSNGFNTEDGFKLIRKQLKKIDLATKKIYLFYEPYYSIEGILISRCEKLGFKRKNIILSSEAGSEKQLETVDMIYIGEGNTFEILKLLQDRKLIEPIRKAISKGAAYIGASAGAMIAGKDILCADDFEKNEVDLSDLSGLCLIDAAIIPHYSKKQLREYVKNMNPEIAKSYQRIYAIKDGGILVR